MMSSAAHGAMPVGEVNGLLLGEASLQQRFWFGENAGTFGDIVDPVYFFIFWVSAFFFVVLMVLMVYFGIRYRRRPGVAAEPSPSHNTPLELVWSIVPTILMAVMFIWGVVAYLPTRIAPADAEVVYVSARKWAWEFEYRGGVTSKQTEMIADLEVPVFALPAGRPVNFIMTSSDVIHSMFLPAFRTKRDVLPNRYTTMWVEAQDRPTHRMKQVDADNWVTEQIDPGNPGYYLFCTEYCGDQHSQMGARIMVMAQADYLKWLALQSDTSGIPLIELGELLWKAKGCNACHTVTGARGTGPTWQNVWGQARPGWTSGDPGYTDEGKVGLNYIRQSIYEPAAYLVQGYANQMPSYQGKINEREVRAIAIYMMSLSDAHRAAALEQSAAESAAREAAKAQEAGGEAAPPQQ